MTRLRVARAAGILDDGDTVYTAALPDGPIIILDGVAALIWAEACRGDRSTIAERVAASTDAAAEAIRPDVEAFVDELVRRGVLEPDPG